MQKGTHKVSENLFEKWVDCKMKKGQNAFSEMIKFFMIPVAVWILFLSFLSLHTINI